MVVQLRDEPRLGWLDAMLNWCIASKAYSWRDGVAATSSYNCFICMGMSHSLRSIPTSLLVFTLSLPAQNRLVCRDMVITRPVFMYIFVSMWSICQKKALLLTPMAHQFNPLCMSKNCYTRVITSKT